jgi:hypothetical protein
LKELAGISSKASLDTADQIRNRMKQIQGFIGDAGKNTTEQTNARDAPVSQSKLMDELNKKRVEDATKRYSQVEATGSRAEDLEPQIKMVRSLVNSPGFNSGIGRPFTDTLSQVGNALFGDPNMATPGQFFDKLRAGSILNEIRSLGASGAGPVRVAEMKFIDNLYAGRDVQPSSIRAVVEVESRMNDRVKHIYQMAQDYLTRQQAEGKPAMLDEGFNKEVSKYKSEKALFSQAELTHPDLMAMPVFNSAAEMRASKMPPGTKFRNAEGHVGTIP